MGKEANIVIYPDDRLDYGQNSWNPTPLCTHLCVENGGFYSRRSSVEG